MMDVVVLLDGKIGRSAELFDILSEAAVDVRASCVFPRLGGRVAHIAVDVEAYDAVEDLLTERLGGVADQRPCIVVPPGYPGGIAEIARKIADAQIVVSVSYYGERGELVLATSDGERTREVLGL
ncbi:MAG TPA: hypothetical protein VIW46_04115 [Acidimicrobiia bacterium]|jgi:hypothetical protein